MRAGRPRIRKYSKTDKVRCVVLMERQLLDKAQAYAHNMDMTFSDMVRLFLIDLVEPEVRTTSDK